MGKYQKLIKFLLEIEVLQRSSLQPPHSLTSKLSDVGLHCGNTAWSNLVPSFTFSQPYVAFSLFFFLSNSIFLRQNTISPGTGLPQVTSFLDEESVLQDSTSEMQL